MELEPGPELGQRVGARPAKDLAHLSLFCCTFGEANCNLQAFRWGDWGMGLAGVLVPPVGHVGAVGPWVGMVAELQFLSLAMLEDAGDGQDFRSGFGEAADPAATAAARTDTLQSVPKRQPGVWGGETGQWGMGGWEASHDHLHCSEGMM